jgi:hypothetical protein
MALKDWKRDKGYKYHWVNKKKGITIRAIFIENGYAIDFLRWTSSDGAIITDSKPFDTLEGAIKFAKDYMRSH